MNQVLIQAGYHYSEQTLVWKRQGYTGIAYSDGDEVEQRIGSIIANATDLRVLSDELRIHCTDWPSLYHLSGTRANILRPFESELRGDVLEIGAGCGAITRYLGECGGKVLALEGSPRRAAIARSRTRDLDNVAVVSDRFDDFRCDRKFDIVTVIGVLEYANMFTAGVNPTLSMLERARSFLKPSGRLIVAIENQLGLKYFAGAPEDHLSIPMYGIEGRYRKDQPHTFGRKALFDLIKKAGFETVECLAPFPDYKVPISIVTEHGFLCEGFDAGALAWQTVRRDAQLPQFLTFSPELVWPTIADNGLALDLSNSFLLVASAESSDCLVSSSTLAWHFSSDRKEKYTKQAQFVREEGGALEVRYQPLSNIFDSGEPDKLVALNLPTVESYKSGVPLLQKAVGIVAQDGWNPNQVGEFLLEFVEVLSGLLGLDYLEVSSSPYNTLPGDAFDLTPQNIIALKDGGYAIIDREWVLHEPLELGFLLFRSLIALLNTVTKFGLPEGAERITRGELVFKSLVSAGFQLDAKDVERYLKQEGDLREAIIGISNTNYLEWEADKPLSTLRETESLALELAAMEDAKASAEALAHSHLSKLEVLQVQLTEMEAAKSYAEKLAIGRYNDINKLRSALSKIQSSVAYKLLAKLRLVPSKSDTDV